jgi:hypothetical protein
MNKVSKSILIISFLTLVYFVAGTHDLQAQSSGKKTSHADEMLEADAYAFAYITCKLELAKYRSEADPKNGPLKQDVKVQNELFQKFRVRADVRYRMKAAYSGQFDRKYKSAWKELSICIKYQNSLDAQEENEKKSR